MQGRQRELAASILLNPAYNSDHSCHSQDRGLAYDDLFAENRLMIHADL